jgi:glycerophosphoryl diester phosphodiesterase
MNSRIGLLADRNAVRTGRILRLVEPVHPFLARADGRPGPIAFAHRGGAAEGDENTIDAFTRAVRLGYRHLETDVHTTADGVAVVFHDKTTDRLLGRPGRVGELRWRDLTTVRVGGAAAVPRLADLLGAWPAVYLNIDVKSDAAVEPTVTALDAAKARDRVLLASFDDRRLRRLRGLAGPDVPTSLGQLAVTRLWAASRLVPGATARPTHRFGPRPRRLGTAIAAQVPLRRGRLTVTDRRLVRYVHRLGLAVHVWTVDDAGQIRGLLELGVDGIMTDHVDVLRDVYVQRGLWPA